MLYVDSGPCRASASRSSAEVLTEDRHGIVQGLPERFPPEVFLRATRSPRRTPPSRRWPRAAPAGRHDRPAAPPRRPHPRRIALRYRGDPGRNDGRAGRREGHGVCQDFTHIFIAAARHARGIPARYMSGYSAAATASSRRRPAMPGPRPVSRISAGSPSTPPTAISATSLCPRRLRAGLSRRGAGSRVRVRVAAARNGGRSVG